MHSVQKYKKKKNIQSELLTIKPNGWNKYLRRVQFFSCVEKNMKFHKNPWSTRNKHQDESLKFQNTYYV